jgi:hypothetical protein
MLFKTPDAFSGVKAVSIGGGVARVVESAPGKRELAAAVGKFL